MRFIFLDDDGNATPDEMIRGFNLSTIQYLPPLMSKYNCCRIIDPIIGHINLAVSLNCNKGIAKFVVNNCEIHSLVRFNQVEKETIKIFFEKYA